MDIEKRVWIVARLAEIGKKLDEVNESNLSRREKQELIDSLRAERRQLRRELDPDGDDIALYLQSV